MNLTNWNAEKSVSILHTHGHTETQPVHRMRTVQKGIVEAGRSGSVEGVRVRRRLGTFMTTSLCQLWFPYPLDTFLHQSSH